MNFHITNWRRPWHPPDEAALAELIAIGCSWIEAAKILARTPKAIECRAKILRERSPKKPPESKPTRCIPKPDLPAFYAIGWKVVEFSAETVAIEWARSGEARQP